MKWQSCITLRMKSSDKNILSIYKNFLMNLFDKKSIICVFSPPEKKKIITLLKSPHVYKKAKDQFEIRYYTLVISFCDLNISLNKLRYLLLNKPSSIHLTLKKGGF